jgi:hypothetical protein
MHLVSDRSQRRVADRRRLAPLVAVGGAPCNAIVHFKLIALPVRSMQHIADYITHVPVAVEPSDDGIGVTLTAAGVAVQLSGTSQTGPLPDAIYCAIDTALNGVRLQHAGGARPHGVAAPLPPLQSAVHRTAKDAAMLRRMSSARQA